MPEGCSLHRLARRYDTLKAIPLDASSPQGRFAEEAALLQGRPLVKAYAHGKHLFLEFSPEDTVHIHLGLYGHVTWRRPPETSTSPSVRLRLTAPGRSTADLIGAARCEILTAQEVAQVRARLGQDPLDPQASVAPLLPKLSKSKKAVGEILMDQTLFAGVGNVYRAELLWRAQVNPWTPARDIPREIWENFFSEARALMGEAVVRGFMVTRDAARRGEEGPRTYAYKRAGDPCERCGETLAQGPMAGRTIYWCPGCQGNPPKRL